MLQFGKHLYKRGHSINPEAESASTTQLKEAVDSLWPCTWQGAMKLLQQAGYGPPKTLHVCLNDSHYGHWDVMEEGKCQYCGESGKIPYYYLSLSEKVCINSSE